jgi:KEOPS complex subunit Cgi121
MEVIEGRLDADPEAFVGEVTDIGEAHGCAVQAVDARYVAGREHLRAALAHADRAIERGENVARERAVEILLYAAGRRQINRALEMGVDSDTDLVVAVADGAEEADAAAAVADRLAPIEDGAALAATEEAALCQFFDVSVAEREAAAGDLADLVCERVALLDVRK